MRILGQIIVGSAFLVAGFYVGTQVFTSPLVAVLLAAAIVAAAVAVGTKGRHRSRREKAAGPDFITVDA